MISIYVKQMESTWLGVAYIREEIIATAVNSNRDKIVRNLLRSIPSDDEHQFVEQGSHFAEKTILMLKELHAGNEEHKSFTLATEYITEPIAKVLKAAAAIPIGYVAPYGGIAKTANTEPKLVGRIMATNPLYPIVPCHRVVGADFSLVGYGGRKNSEALQAKLARLRKEARGYTAKKEVPVNGERLTIYPVEHVINKARKNGLDYSQQELFPNRKAS